MALIRCAECGKLISSLAQACFNCGAPTRKAGETVQIQLPDTRGGLRLALSVPVRVRHERAGADALGGQAWGNRRFYPEAAGTGDRRSGRICRSCFGRRRAGRKIRADSGIGRGRECRISNYRNKFRRLISSRKIRRNVQRDGKPDFCAQKNQDSVSEILAEGKATSSGFAALSHLPQRGRQSFVSEILEMRLIRAGPELAALP